MGLLDSAQPQQAQQPSSDMVQMGDVKSKMVDLQRLVIAGKKILYSAKTREKILAGLQPTPESVGNTIAGVMGLILNQAGPDKAKPDLIVPAGVMLVGDLLKFLSETQDVEVTDELSKASIAAFAQVMVDQMGPAQQAQQPQQPAAQPAAQQPQMMGA